MSEVARLFLKFGFLGFGGPIAVMAMFEEETCRKRDWLTSEHFAQMYAVLKMMPGPLAMQMAVYLGMLRAGKLGGIVAGGLFTLPAFVMVLALSYFYFHTGVVAQASEIFNGLQAGALVVIVLSTFTLAGPYRAKWSAWVIGLASAALVINQPRLEPLIIFGAGLLGAAVTLAWSGAWSRVRLHSAQRRAERGPDGAAELGAVSVAGASAAIAIGAATVPTLSRLAWVCFKAGAFVFGSGLAIVPLLEGDTVGHYHWLTHSQFMDGLAVGQITPGPVVITATFIGYKTAGWIGSVLATVCIFFPCFFNVLFVVPRVWNRLSYSRIGVGFIESAIPAVIGCILGTTARLGWLTLTTPAAIVVFVLAFALAVKFKPPSWVVIPLAGLMAAGARLI